MHLLCPYCTTVFDISIRDLGISGRQVQCGVCEHEWFVDPASYDDMLEDERLPVDVFLDINEVQRTSSEDLDELSDGRFSSAAPLLNAPVGMPSLINVYRQEVKRNRFKQILVAVSWTILLASTFIMLFYATVYRDKLVAQFPALSKIYRVVNLDIDGNTNIRNFIVERSHFSVQFRNHERILHVKGKIKNIGDVPGEIPTLRLSINNTHSKEEYVARVRSSQTVIAPGEAVAFEHTIFDFPENAHNIVLVFLNRSEALYSRINLASE